MIEAVMILTMPAAVALARVFIAVDRAVTARRERVTS